MESNSSSTINYNLLHKINQMTYLFTIDYDSDKSYYSTRLSIDLRYLNIGTYTMVFEMKFFQILIRIR